MGEDGSQGCKTLWCGFKGITTLNKSWLILCQQSRQDRGG